MVTAPRISRRRSLGPASAAGITLVELLVVLAICAALAALLFTTGFYVRQRSKVVLCAANLHSLGVAIAAYVSDYDAVPLVYPLMSDRPPGWSRCPPAPPPDHTPAFVLKDYLSRPEAFDCPVLHARLPQQKWWPVEPDWWMWVDVARYEFNPHVSGMRVPPGRKWAGPARTLTMYDQLPTPHHLRRYNALFLDGHVKAYRWVVALAPARNVPWPPG